MYTEIRALLEAESDRIILWVPVCMGLGVAWYFHLRFEPPLWLGAGGMAVFTLFIIVIAGRRSRRGNPAEPPNARKGWIAALTMFARADGENILFYLSLIAALFFFGVALAQYRTHSIHSPVLAAPVAVTHVTGRITEIAPTPKGSKILLEDVSIDKLPRERTPTHISLTLRSYDPDLVTGQIVSLRAGLFPPPAPALPGGFDFSRYFYFREIGAVEYGIGRMEVKSLKESGLSDFDIWFAEFRHRLTEAMRSYFSEPAGSVAAAFITGETREIPDSVNDDMRIAGLYHLLAVSGMNLSVVAGLAFFSLRFLLAAIPRLALHYPIKKWAAALALAASYVYLRVSGTPVSAERAFFMVSLVFIAILLDRDPSPMRSVAFAAFCIILYEPEEALSASFQLSFSATAALIASYEWGAARFARGAGASGVSLKRVALYFAAVMGTSLVAWLATEPFIIYHFNQFSSYSLLSNTVAEPLVSFVLMPLVIAGVLLLPFGLAWIAFVPLQYGVNLLLSIAHKVAHLPYAMTIVPNPSDYGFALAVLGALWIYFWRWNWRWLGIFAVAAGMATAFSYLPPDMIIDADGRHVAARGAGGRMEMIHGRARNLTAQQWARASLQTELAEGEDTDCDSYGCVAHAGGRTVAMLKSADALADDCRLADIVIAPVAVTGAACPAPALLDKSRLESGGAASLWFEPGGHIRIRQVRDAQGERPWVAQPTLSELSPAR